MAKRIVIKVVHEWLFTAAILAATITTLIFRKNPLEYLEGNKFEVLWILFVMMLVNEGLDKKGILSRWGYRMISFANDKRTLSFMFLTLTAVMAPFVTNDVALIVVVPLTLSVAKASGFDPMWTIIFESVVANATSSITPFGNPQNIYLYTHYNAPPIDFMWVTLKFAVVALSFVIVSVFFTKNDHLKKPLKDDGIERRWWIYLVFLVFMIVAIMRTVNVYLVGLFIVSYISIFDRSLLRKVDYFLLGTFIAFFVFSGDITSVTFFKEFGKLLSNGRNVFAISSLASQGISNVPSAIIFSHFTDQWKSLLLGVSVGGLGTIIASLSNLIAFSAYKKYHSSGRYLMAFHIYSILLFVAMFTIFFVGVRS